MCLRPSSANSTSMSLAFPSPLVQSSGGQQSAKRQDYECSQIALAIQSPHIHSLFLLSTISYIAFLLISLSSLAQIVKDTVWLFEQQQALALSNVTTNIRMTIIKLKTGELWVHAPIAPTQYASPACGFCQAMKCCTDSLQDFCPPHLMV